MACRWVLGAVVVGSIFPGTVLASDPAPSGSAVSSARAIDVPLPRFLPDPPAPAPAPEHQVVTDPDESLFASPTRLDHIGRIVIPVMINGQGPFRFIVDTGASHSTLSPVLAGKLHLPATAEPIQVNGITGTALVPAVFIAHLDAGALSLKDASYPLIWAPLMAGTDGILGAAGLTEQRLFVDFRHNRVVITNAGRRTTPAGFMRIPAMRVAGGLISVEAMVGDVRVRAVIDTGSERSLGNPALQAALSQRRRVGTLVRATDVYGATATVVTGDAQTIPAIMMGDLRITDATLVYGDFHIFSVWHMQAKPALIIGMDILGTVSSMAIDFAHGEFYIGGAPSQREQTSMWRTYKAQ